MDHRNTTIISTSRKQCLQWLERFTELLFKLQYASQVCVHHRHRNMLQLKGMCQADSKGMFQADSCSHGCKTLQMMKSKEESR
jgi:hypothetical protein